MRCNAILEGRERGLVLKLLASEQRREASGRAALQQQPAPGPRPSAPCCPGSARAAPRRRPPRSTRGPAPPPDEKFGILLLSKWALLFCRQITGLRQIAIIIAIMKLCHTSAMPFQSFTIHFLFCSSICYVN